MDSYYTTVNQNLQSTWTDPLKIISELQKIVMHHLQSHSPESWLKKSVYDLFCTSRLSAKSGSFPIDAMRILISATIQNQLCALVLRDSCCMKLDKSPRMHSTITWVTSLSYVQNEFNLQNGEILHKLEMLLNYVRSTSYPFVRFDVKLPRCTKAEVNLVPATSLKHTWSSFKLEYSQTRTTAICINRWYGSVLYVAYIHPAVWVQT